MKKPLIILAVVLAICVGLLAGAVHLYNDIFPTAPAIHCPRPDAITEISLRCNSGENTVPMDEQHYEELIQYISQAKPTRRQAINDVPTVRHYYCFEVQTEQRLYGYFIYEEGEQVYLEIPYEGIYESDMSLLNLALQYIGEE